MFKIGDRVVVIDDCFGYVQNEKATIIDINEMNITLEFDDKSIDSKQNNGWNDFELVLEEIYNSPLYQALKEEQNG